MNNNDFGIAGWEWKFEIKQIEIQENLKSWERILSWNAIL